MPSNITNEDIVFWLQNRPPTEWSQWSYSISNPSALTLPKISAKTLIIRTDCRSSLDLQLALTDDVVLNMYTGNRWSYKRDGNPYKELLV